MTASRIRRLVAAFAACVLLASTASCSSPIGLPSAGGVQEYAPVSQQTRRVYTNPEGPVENDQPEGIVEGFFNAMPAGVQSDGYRVAREFLTSQASGQWSGDSSALVYDGTPNYTRRASTQSGSPEMGGALVVEVELDVIGSLDAHGVYTPAIRKAPVTLEFTMVKSGGQWRISHLDDGVAVSSADFDQVFRQVSVYQVASAGNRLVPDVRWFSWRNWRTQAVREVLAGGSAWLGDAVRSVNTARASLAVDSVPVDEGTPYVQLNGEFTKLDVDDRAMLVRLIKLTLGDGVAGSSVKIAVDGNDYSNADSGVDLDDQQPNVSIYTLTDTRVVSLGSSSPLRVGETDITGAKGFAFSASGGAALRDDGVVECLRSDASSCGVMFAGVRMSFIAAGLNGEIWAVPETGRSLYVSHDDIERQLSVPWLGPGTIRAVTVSPEGARLALAVDDGVRLTGIARDGNMTPTGLADREAEVSRQHGVTMLTFYNDLNLVYVTGAGGETAGGQRAFRQIVPGPAQDQRLPGGVTVTGLASGQIALYRRLAVLDSGGIVRSVTGSLDGSWAIADSQVAALGAQ